MKLRKGEKMAPISYIPKQSKELTNDEIKKLIKENHVNFIRMQFVDINGQVKIWRFPPSKSTKSSTMS